MTQCKATYKVDPDASRDLRCWLDVHGPADDPNVRHVSLDGPIRVWIDAGATLRTSQHPVLIAEAVRERDIREFAKRWAKGLLVTT